MNEAAIQSVKNVSSIGQQQYEIYKCERLIQGKVSIFSTISQNKLPLFRAKNRVTTSIKTNLRWLLSKKIANCFHHYMFHVSPEKEILMTFFI